MNTKMIRVSLYKISVMRTMHDYLRYTFTTATASVLVLGALIALTAIVLFALNDPTIIILIVCVYIAIFLTAMVVSLSRWLKYRSFYKSVFK